MTSIFKKKSSSSGDKKNSAPKVPAFQPSEIRYGDNVVGKTFKDANGSIVTQFLPSPEESAREKMVQTRINEILPTLGQTAPELRAMYDEMGNTFINQQTEAFNREYEPIMRNMREDMFSRFGTGKSTPYLDKIQEMETNIRTPALRDIVQRGVLMKQDLGDQDQARKLRELSALGYNLSADQQDFLNMLAQGQNAASLGNQFNLNQYLYKAQQFNNDRAFRQQNTMGLLNAMGGFF